MDSKTQIFIKASQQMLRGMKEEGADPNFIKLIKDWAVGRCCGEPLRIISVEKTGSGVRRLLECGHVHDAISMAEASDSSSGHSTASLNLAPDGIQTGTLRVGGNQYNKEDREIMIVKSLCHGFKMHLSNFRNDTQNSPVDVISSDEIGNMELFQVTRLHGQDYWKNLALEKRAQFVSNDLSSLIGSAIERKINYDKKSKGDIVLVIDAWPGMMDELAEMARSLPILSSSGFKEIWIAGPTKELTYKIYP